MSDNEDGTGTTVTVYRPTSVKWLTNTVEQVEAELAQVKQYSQLWYQLHQAAQALRNAIGHTMQIGGRTNAE